MPFLLKTKPWLLFLILYVLPFFFLIGPAVAVGLYAFIRLGWLCSVGVGLQGKLPPEVKMNVRVFKVAFMIPVADIILYSTIYLSFFVFHVFGGDDARGTMIGVLTYLAPLHLLAVLGSLYTLWFCSRVINSIEQKRSAPFIDCLADFFAILFFIVGVWLVQGRVNKAASL